jgi:CubicO group peptidase (beta-lactamase class C family)
MTLTRTAVEDAAAYAASWIEYRQRTADVPGLQVAIRHEDDLVLSAAFGVADLRSGEPLRTDHGFRIASHSKTFTATVVLLLAERGQLALDDTLGRHLPWLAGAPLGGARLREVLSHAAGIVRDGDDVPWWQLRGPFHDEAGLRAAATDPAAAVLLRNERFKYSNIGYSLLGQVIEAVTGEPYADVVRREVVDHLGLARTGPEPGPDDLPRLATGHSGRRYGIARRPFPHLDTRAMAAATGFHATAEDVCRYGAAHFLGNEELLRDDTKREMQHEHWEVRGGRGGHYGLGFHVVRVGGRRVLTHGGGFPGFITFTAIDPDDHLVVTALTNAIDGPAETVVNAVLRLVGRAAEGGDPDPTLDRYTGRFLGMWAVTDVARLGGDLLAIDPELLDPVPDATRLESTGADDDHDELRIAETTGFGSFGERVRFEWDEHGRPARVRFAGAWLLPEAAYLQELAARTEAVD